jgi:hypothetical protein
MSNAGKFGGGGGSAASSASFSSKGGHGQRGAVRIIYPTPNGQSNTTTILDRGLPSTPSLSLYGGGGAGDVTSSSAELNTYAYVTDTTTSSGATSLTVNSTTGMSAGDVVFIHQTQNAVSSSDAGLFEVNYIASIPNSTTINLVNATTNTYRSGSYNTTNQTSTVTQVVASPAYNNLTLGQLALAKQWDGQSGGILFLAAETSFDGNGYYASAWGRGFRGGRGSGNAGSQSIGYAAESIRGHLNSTNVANDNGGGGADGTVNAGGDSGAGGGHAEAGGPGTDGAAPQPSGGGTIGSTAMTQIYFGGGGGRGGDNDSRTFNNYTHPDTGTETTGSTTWSTNFSAYTSFNPSWGSSRHSSGNPDVSHGGGIVVIWSPSISALRATARGVPGMGGSSSGEKSGHGASGSIYIKTANNGMTVTDMTVREQTQGTIDGDSIGKGGAGRIRFDIEGGTSYTGTPTTGTNGTLQVNNV